MTCSVFVGTSGFSYPEWVEHGIYPPGTKSADMLQLYSVLFPVIELNYTWYQMVRKESVERMLSRLEKPLYFTAKLTRSMTHEIDGHWRHQAALYCEGIKPLLEADSLLAVLVQFPAAFHRTQANRYYLSHLFDALADLPLAVEFRNSSWAHEQVYAGLQQRNITLVTVDTPPLPRLFPCLDVVTNPKLFYIRLHGRNSQGWYSGTMQQQFNYLYSNEELLHFQNRYLLSLQHRCSQGVIFFNNHVAGQAVHNAKTLVRMLQQ
ncbi:DUF72 domain-containing protein [Desulfogranum japonicum]|uniref:DUF72 domain-containing protein n=1 Tax=Desulfogranum japonicum TaxID=231447 RepID=UPI0003FF1F25|nr:DUF72 domain-containing protein [Desulfogranum japonicum]